VFNYIPPTVIFICVSQIKAVVKSKWSLRLQL